MDRLLSFGARGEDVEEAQGLLNDHPPTQFPLLATDGIFGPKTSARVREFQKNNNLVADGIVGPKTWKALRASQAPPAPPAAAAAPATRATSRAPFRCARRSSRRRRRRAAFSSRPSPAARASRASPPPSRRVFRGPGPSPRGRWRPRRACTAPASTS